MINCSAPLSLIQHFLGSPVCASELGETLGPLNATAREYFKALVLTLALEWPVYFLFLRKYWKGSRLTLAVVVINLLTHPAVWFFWPWVLSSGFFQGQVSFGAYVAIAETFAPTVEALALWKMGIPFRRAVWAAICANLCSWGVGAWIG